MNLALQQMRSRGQHYKESVSAVGSKGVAMADAIEIAKTINTLAESLRDAGIAVDGETYADLNQSLMQASEKLQACSQFSKTTPRAHVSPKKVSFYNQSFLPLSPRRQISGKTPKRSNCTTGSDRIPSSTSGFSDSSGYLATIGDEDSCVLTPRIMNDAESPEVRLKGKKGTRLSLNFDESSKREKNNRKIRILDGKNDITIWGPSVNGLTLRTGSSSSSAENYRQGKTAKDVEFKAAPVRERVDPPSSYNYPSDSKKTQLVLGAMKTPSAEDLKDSKEKDKNVVSLAPAVAMDTIFTSSSSVSEFLPSDGHDRKKWKSAKDEGENGFEVFLEQTSQQKRYSSNTLRERADFSEKLQRKRREILDIKQDLELCSMLLDQCNEGASLRSGEAPKLSLPPIIERRAKETTDTPLQRAIIRE